MAEVEEPQFNSLADRIAALNRQKNFTSPAPVAKRPPPPPPPVKQQCSIAAEEAGDAVARQSPSLPARPRPSKREPPAVPQRANTTPASEPAARTPPALPGRPPLPSRKATSEQAPTPTLPPRRPTHSLASRRGSNSSEISHISSISNLSLSRASTASVDSPASRRVLAPAFDQAKLPPLPPSRREREAQAAKERAEQERTEVISPPLIPTRPASIAPTAEPSGRPSLPPRLPSRPATGTPIPAQTDETRSTGPRRLPPPPSAFVKPKATLEGSSGPPPVPSSRPGQGLPPPIPLSSRPTRAEIGAVAVRAATNTVAVCMICRDFSGPDTVAARYPNHSLPRHDPVGYLANALCAPFQSATDKARAIFAWCHHNIAYNVEEFFGKCVKGRDVNETIFLGKAVCQGYAEVYQAIAQKAGLQCVVVGGHGKGYGYTPLTRGQAPPPRNPTGHAWNAVCIDNGEWKLIDACWGAGSVGDQKYQKHFNPKMFTLTNEQFGLSHFPSNDRHFYREDGRILSWEEYISGPVPGVERPQWCSGAFAEGLSSDVGYSPAEKHVSVYSGEVVRFQFSKICQHWTHEKNGKGPPYLLLLNTHGVDGRNKSLVPLDTDGYWWWIDIPARDLGAPGMNVQLCALTVVNGQDARGVTKEEFNKMRETGANSLSWAIWCSWELVN
ncbi:putative transglutaminase-like superfamily protein [Rosellinia necatrix]|uniref:Putative transglutaminase-like superfamily protein n=1 Tax=Rosellinia necatrix TaxID=77044 RepID=A0A1W2TH07_ROSNE|nr:putative transglutaminase-like superfamily protein [Rosellinia necatrix]